MTDSWGYATSEAVAGVSPNAGGNVYNDEKKYTTEHGSVDIFTTR